jgi:L-ornithine N5-oxygenase
MKRHEIFDILGLGFGPSNIALAVAIEESGFDGSVLMFERRSCAQWFPDMLLPGSDIQNHPSRDLVTPRNPRSRYTFLNFLHEHGMLFEHLNLGIEFPLRAEYAKYISWVASFFSRWVRYGSNVTGISQVTNGAGEVYKLTLSDGSNYYGRALVVAPGRTPHIPAPFLEQLGPQVFHLTDYLSRLKAVEAVGPLRHVCVVGGSQSAAETVLHLRQNYPNARITNIVRGYGYRLKDTSQFSERVYFPEFVDYYYRCDRQAKKRLNTFLRLTNYSAADGDVIQQLYTTIYEDKLCGHRRIDLYTNHEVLACNVEAGAVSMELCEVNTGQLSKLNGIDAVVLATGFKDLGTATGQERVPAILNDIASDLLLDEDGVLHVERDYRLLPRTHSTGLPPLYLNGLCESSHGLGDAGSFSLLSLRGADICRSLLNALQWEPASDAAVFEDASEPERALTQLGTA